MVIGHFIDVEQTGEAVFEFNDNAEFQDLDDFSVYDIISSVVGDSGFPWIREAVFVREGDSLFFTIEGFDLDVNDLIRFEDVFHFADLLPGDIGDVEQAFYAIDADESTVWHDLLDSALKNVAVFISSFDFIHFIVSGIFQYCFAGENQSILSAVNFEDLSREFLSDQVLQGVNEAQVALGQRNEAAEGLQLNEQTNFDSFDAFAFDSFAFFESFFNNIPVSQTVNFDLGYVNGAVFFDTADDLYTKFVANFEYVFQRCWCRECIFMSLQYSFCFVAEGNIGFVVEYVDNFPFYYTAFMHVQVHFFLFQHFFHVFHNKNYLLYDPVRCGCTGGDANLVPGLEPFRF